MCTSLIDPKIPFVCIKQQCGVSVEGFSRRFLSCPASWRKDAVVLFEKEGVGIPDV